MGCKFEYNGKWYEEAELKDIFDSIGYNIASKSVGAKINVMSTEGIKNLLKNLSGKIRFDFFDAKDKELSDKIHEAIFSKKPVSEINALIAKATNIGLNVKFLPRGLVFANKGYTIINNVKDFTDVEFATGSIIKLRAPLSGKFTGRLVHGQIITTNASQEFKDSLNKYTVTKDIEVEIPKYKAVLFSAIAPKKTFSHKARVTSNSPLGYTLGVEGNSWNIEIGDMENKFPKELFKAFNLSHIGNKSLGVVNPLGWIGGKIVGDVLVITELQSDLLQNTHEISKTFPSITRSSVENTYEGWEKVFLSTAIEMMKRKYPNINRIALPTSALYTSKVPKAKNISKLYDSLAKDHNMTKGFKQDIKLNKNLIFPIAVPIDKFQSTKGFIINGDKYKFKFVKGGFEYVLTNEKEFSKTLSSDVDRKFIINKRKGGAWQVANEQSARDVIYNIIKDIPHFKKYSDRGELATNLAGFRIADINSLVKPLENKNTQIYYDVYIKTYIKTFVKNMRASNPDLGSDSEMANDAVDFLREETFIKQFLSSEEGVAYMNNLQLWLDSEFSKEHEKDLINLSSEDEGGVLVDSEGNEVEESEETEVDKLVKTSLKKQDFLYSSVDIDFLLDELNRAIKAKDKAKQDIIKQILSEVQSEGNSNLKFMYNQDGTVQGFTYNSEIYLNEDAPHRTLVEEAAHLWIDKIKQSNNSLYTEGLRKIENSPYLIEVLENPFYVREASKLGDENSTEYQNYLKEEALSKAIKDEGVGLSPDEKISFLSWLNKLFEELKKVLGFTDKSIEDVKSMSLSEFSKNVVRDIFRDVKEFTPFLHEGIWHRGTKLREVFDSNELNNMVGGEVPWKDNGDFDRTGAIMESTTGVLMHKLEHGYGLSGSEQLANEQQIMNQIPGTEGSVASPKTLALVSKFLERIGVKKQELPQYDLNGQKIDANGQANLLNDVIKIAEGKEDVALTEETMHFAVAIMKQTNPKLFKQMMNKIGSFNYYKTVFNEYSKRYVNKDGSPDILKIKEEAIGKILAEYLINNVEGATEKPELLAQTITWWQQIKDFFLALIGKATFNPFETAVKELDNIQDTKALDAPYKELADRIIEKAPPGIQGAAANGAHKKGNYRAVVSMFSEQLEDERTYQTIIDDYLQGDEQLAQEILRAGEAFLQTAPAKETIFDKINKKIQDFQLVKRTDKADPDDENNNSFYEITVNGRTEKVDRTTEWAKKQNIIRNGGKDYLATATPAQKKIWAQKAMSGTNGHTALENIIKHNLLPDGTLKPKEEWTAPDNSLVDHSIYVDMARFLLGYREPVTGEIRQGFLDQFPAGSIFGLEKILYNEKTKRASTLDLIVQLPDDSLKVYDWKFMGFLLEKPDQAFLKRSQHALQLGDYKTSLKEAYGVKKVDAYTVPIHAEYMETASDVKLKGVTFGNVNFKNETRTPLLPVVPMGQSTGNKEIDGLIASLEAHYKKLYNKKEDPKTKYVKFEQLQQLSNAIRNLQIALNFDPLSYESINFQKNSKRSLEKYKDLRFESLDEATLREQLDELLEMFHSSETYAKIDEVFSSEYKDIVLTKKNEETLGRLRIGSSSAKLIREKVLNILEKYVSFIAQKEGVDNVLSPTKEVSGALNNMIERGSILLPMANLAVKRALDARSEDRIKEAREIEKFGEKYIALNKLASAGGKTPFQLIGDGTQLIKKIKKEFWTQFNEAKDKQDRKFFLANIDKEAFDKDLEDEVNRREEVIRDTIYSSSPTENTKRQEQQIKNLYNSLNIYSSKFTGWNDRAFTNMVKRHIIEKPHWTEEYRAMHESAGKYNGTEESWNSLSESEKIQASPLAMYSYLQELNKRAFKSGYLEHNKSMAFFPMVTGTILERLAQGSSVGGTLSSLMSDIYKLDSSEEQAYGAVNPETGALEKSVPRLFTRTNREGEALSKDLLKVIPLYIRALQEYETSKDLEMELLTYYQVERAKKHLESEGNQIIMDADGPKEFSGNENNANILADMTDWLVYGIREFSNTIFDVGVSTIAKGTKEEKAQKSLNLKKAVTEGNKLTQGLAVGLKLLVAIPNYMGAHMQAAVNAGLYYTWPEFISNHHRIVGSMLLGTGADIDKGLIDLMIPLNDDIVKEGQRKIAAKQSPAKWLSTWTFQEFLMSTNRWPDKAHQLTNAKTFNDNSMVVDGKIVNIRQHLLSLPEYKGRYASGNVKEIEKQLEEKVKELKASSSLPKIAKFNKEGFLEIPGVSPEEIAKYRTSVIEYGRKLTGQMSEENAAKYRQDILVKSFMMFKNWIPKQVSLRTLDIKKNPSLDQWEYGRTRLFIKTILHLGPKNLLKMRDIISASPEGIRIMKEMVDKKREDYFNKTGLELTITDEEFYDMVRKELSAQAKEFIILMSLIGTVVAAKLAAPPDEEDPLAKNRYKFWAKAINKISDEMWFYYSPTSAESMTRGSLFPALGLISKAEKTMRAAGKDIFGYVEGDEEAMEKAHTLKYFFNMVPVASQFQNELFPLIDPEGAKEWGIVVSEQARAMR